MPVTREGSKVHVPRRRPQESSDEPRTMWGESDVAAVRLDGVWLFHEHEPEPLLCAPHNDGGASDHLDDAPSSKHEGKLQPHALGYPQRPDIYERAGRTETGHALATGQASRPVEVDVLGGVAPCLAPPLQLRSKEVCHLLVRLLVILSKDDLSELSWPLTGPLCRWPRSRPCSRSVPLPSLRLCGPRLHPSTLLLLKWSRSGRPHTR